MEVRTRQGALAILIVLTLLLAACNRQELPTPERFPTSPPAPLSRPGWTSYTNANDVRGLAFDHDGNLWAVGSGGAIRWAPTGSTYTRYTTEDGLISNDARAVAVAPDGTVWVATGDGASCFDGERWATYTTENGLAGNDVLAITAVPDGALWFGVWGGVSRFDGEEWTTYTVGDGLGVCR